MRLRSLLGLIALVAAAAPVVHAAPSTVVQNRHTEPVVLTGQSFPTWSAGPDPTAREPELPHDYSKADIEQNMPSQLQSECYKPGSNPYDPSDPMDHNCYQSSRLPHNPREGAAVDKLLGYRWDPSSHTFVQIPFQVDEKFTRYLTNNVSGFAFYSGTDAETTYAFDREGFRYTADQSQTTPGGNPCLAEPSSGVPSARGYATTLDPVKGLDDNDELAFMWNDAGVQAPAGTPLPAGIDSAYEVPVADPSNPGNTVFAYVMLAGDGGPTPAYNASNGYVQYARDPNANTFLFSQSSNYGVAPKGPYCDPTTGLPVRNADGSLKIAQRRPADGAWVRTNDYAFRYDGRWLMTQLRISPNHDGLADPAGFTHYGPDIIDQWKARAFQQRPGDPNDAAAGTTPCCGYEEEVNNWGGSSILMGERWGPVRAIRAAWGADSSTNNVKTEIFYSDEIRFQDNLRVHVIPPADGIYVQWDYNAGAVNRYYNPWQANGVAIDGNNDEVFGNTKVHAADDRVSFSDGDPIPIVGPTSQSVPLAPGANPYDCHFLTKSTTGQSGTSQKGVCNDIDLADPAFSGPAGDLNWEEVAGPNGSLVTRWSIHQHTAGDAYSVVAQPYYRDDSCFDDGTGTNPGPHLNTRHTDSGVYNTWTDPATGIPQPRTCWKPGDPITGNPLLDARYVQGDIATHGLHLQIIVDSDNAAQTVPIDEVDSEQRMVVLGGDAGNVGDVYGRSAEFPLQAIARPFV